MSVMSCPVATALAAIGNGDAEQLGISISDARRNPYVLAIILTDLGHPLDGQAILRHRYAACTCHKWA